MLFNKNKYDFIFSLGEACSCSEALRKNDLQVVTNPFDWITGTTLEENVDILLNDFNNFMNFEDLEFANCTNENKSDLCDVYKNKRNKIVFNHEIPAGVKLEDCFEKVKEKYNRRIKRLYEKIEKAQKVLIVYIEVPFNENKLKDNSRLVDALDKIKTKFPNTKIDFLYFTNDTSYEPMKYKKEIINSEIVKIYGNYERLNDMLPIFYVNSKYFKAILKSYQLKLPCFYYIRKYVIRFFIMFVPNREKRAILRKKYHV